METLIASASPKPEAKEQAYGMFKLVSKVHREVSVPVVKVSHRQSCSFVHTNGRRS